MANKKAAKKDILTNKRNRLRNVHAKTLMKTHIKKAVTAIEEKSKEAVLIPKFKVFFMAPNHIVKI